MEAGNLSILIIDDDPVDRAVLRHSLHEGATGALIYEASSGREGIERYGALLPDCVLLDYHLPDLDGLEVVRELKDLRPGCAIVMLTAIGNERVAVDAMKAGVLDYAAKGGATPDSLRHIVHNAVDKARLQAELEEQRRALHQRNRDLEDAVRRETQARRQAESSRLEYHVLVESIPQMVWRSNSDGGVTFSNERWRDYFGENPQAATWIDTISSEERPSVAAQWKRATSCNGNLEIEARMTRKDGQTRWHLICGVAPPDNSEPAWLFTATDVTEQKDAQQAMLQKQKLDSLGLLAGGVAHDFNNLLVGIMGGASFALDTVPRSHPSYSLLESVVESSERAAHLTRQLLAYAGKGRFTIEPIDLSQVVLRTAKLVDAFVPKTVQLHLDLRPRLPVTQGDPGQVEQVAMNLIINAAEAIGQENHGIIAVRTYVEEIASDGQTDACGSSIARGAYVVLEVHDSGCGMTDEVRASIFDPFFTTKFTGRGLGLAAVQGIMRSTHGAIQVDTAPGRGTTFRVYFPVAEAAVAAPAPESPAASPGRGTVLVIDDEEIVQRVAEISLKRAGYGVVVASTGAAGLDALRAHGEITSVLLDMNMPEMSGPEVLPRLRELRPDLPVVVCSGYTEAEVERQFAGLKFSGVIQKPYTAQKLTAQFNALLAAHQTSGQGGGR